MKQTTISRSRSLITCSNTGTSDSPWNFWRLRRHNQVNTCCIDVRVNAPCKDIGQSSCYKQDPYFPQGYIHMLYNLLAKYPHAKGFITPLADELLCAWFVYINLLTFKTIQYSPIPCNRPPKVSSLGGRLREVVAYENLDHILGQKFVSLTYGNNRELTHVLLKRFIHVKVKFEQKKKKKIRHRSLRNVSLVLARNAIMYNISLSNVRSTDYLSCCLRVVKNKKRLLTSSSKSDRSRLREVVAWKRFQI